MILPRPLPEEELLRLLMHGPVGPPETCACGETIVRMPGGHYRLAASDRYVDRIPCTANPEGHHPPRADSPFTTGDAA